MKKNLLFLLCTITLSVFAQPKTEGVYYQIFVRSFCDTDGDGVGDINGVTARLDYLQQLGIKGVWLTPVHPSPTYHKYDVTDYTAIDAEYGTLNDYKRMVQEAHKRGIKVLLDLVVNHTSSEHPWFRSSLVNRDKYRNYYVWSDSAQQHGWYANPRNPQERYYAFFWERMPDLNFDNPEVRREIIEAGKFWLKEVGVDGYRLDAAQHIYEADDVVKNNAWWSEFRTAMRQQNSEVFLIGEVWNKDSIVATYLKNSLDACFNFDLSGAITKAVKDGNATGFVDKLSAIHQLYRTYNPNFTDAIFISNHDQDRYCSTFDGDKLKTKAAFAMLMTLPGIPFLYYGEELGMLGKFPDEYRREPFLWSATGNGNTTWEKPRYTNAQVVAPLDAQQKDAQSLYNWYKATIAMRNAYPVLSEGQLVKTSLVTSTDKLIAYELHEGKERLLVLHYVGTAEQKVKVPAGVKVVWTNQTTLKGKEVTLTPYSSIVLQLN